MAFSRRVYKFKLEQGLSGQVPTLGDQKCARTAEWLAAEQIDGEIYAWARVPVRDGSQAGFETHRPMGFFLTGDEIPKNWRYVDTVVIRDRKGRDPAAEVAEPIEVLHVFDGGGV